MHFIEYKRTDGDYYAKEYIQYELNKPSKYRSVEYINDYSLNIGFIISMPISARFSIFFIRECWPRDYGYSNGTAFSGFAFSNIVSLGIAYKLCNRIVEVRPSFSHLSIGFAESKYWF